MIFDAVHAFAHGLHAMGGSGSLAAPNVTCELLNSWAGGRRLYEHINAVGGSGRLEGTQRLSSILSRAV